MKNFNFNILFSDVKVFMENEVNRALAIWTIMFILLICIVHFEIRSIKTEMRTNAANIERDIVSVKKRVDYRYFNITRSLEDLNNVKIETKEGYLKKKY